MVSQRLCATLCTFRAGFDRVAMCIESLFWREMRKACERMSAARPQVTRIMLDNMSVADMSAAVSLIAGRVETEASGNVTLDNIGCGYTRNALKAHASIHASTRPHSELSNLRPPRSESTRAPPLDRREMAKSGVTFISSGAITHSVKALDISLNIEGDWAKTISMPQGAAS